jgi:ubiquinone/menaquinone biosynthesis C-methylase UbiE
MWSLYWVILKYAFENDRFDVVISNCVLNLVPDKSKAFSEIYRCTKTRKPFLRLRCCLSGEICLKK